MRVAVLHNAVSSSAAAHESDVLDQARVVIRWLLSLGHESALIPCTDDLLQAGDDLLDCEPDVVFNLVESLGGSDRLTHLVPALLHRLRLPYTGVPTEALFLTTHKLLAKQRLRRAGLPTPDWVAGSGSDADTIALASGKYIIKAIWEHASFGLDDGAVTRCVNPLRLRDRVRQRSRDWGKPCFAERFIEGREFNLALLDDLDGPEVLPPTEIDFSCFPAGKPRIVGYQAKWTEGSFEYDNTPRRVDFTDAEQPLLAELSRLAKACWQLFGLRGYARVDFRVDRWNRPWILEVNSNCCLSPDAGFVAALAQARISPHAATQRILHAALLASPDVSPLLLTSMSKSKAG